MNSAYFSLTKICIIIFIDTYIKIFPFKSIHKMQILINHSEALGQITIRNVKY